MSEPARRGKDPDVGDVVDRRFRLVRVIARGGMGIVFEAQQLYTKRAVALKLLPRENVGLEEHRNRLLREGLALASTHHPGFVEVLDAGVCLELGPYLALEMLEGRTLDGLLASRGRLSLVDAAYVGVSVADSLAFAHARGVVHRDLKPSNIFVARNDVGGEDVKIIDLGIAGMAESGVSIPRLTFVNEVLGTPEYMAPEQLNARGGDHRIDVYALGMTLFECLTGELPYVGSYPDIVVQVAQASAPPEVRSRREDVPPALAEAVERALAKDPAARFPDAYAFARAIEEALGPSYRALPGVPVLLESVGPPPLAQRSEPVTGPFPLCRVKRPVSMHPFLLNPQPPGAQRRAMVRVPCVTPVAILDDHGVVAEGRGEDISERGLLLLTTRGCAVGEHLRLRFSLPGTGTDVTTDAQVRWVRPVRGGRNAVGLEFMEPGVELLAVLRQYVKAMRLA